MYVHDIPNMAKMGQHTEYKLNFRIIYTTNKPLTGKYKIVCMDSQPSFNTQYTSDLNIAICPSLLDITNVPVKFVKSQQDMPDSAMKSWLMHDVKFNDINSSTSVTDSWVKGLKFPK